MWESAACVLAGSIVQYRANGYTWKCTLNGNFFHKNTPFKSTQPQLVVRETPENNVLGLRTLAKLVQSQAHRQTSIGRLFIAAIFHSKVRTSTEYRVGTYKYARTYC